MYSRLIVDWVILYIILCISIYIILSISLCIILSILLYIILKKMVLSPRPNGWYSFSQAREFLPEPWELEESPQDLTSP